MHLKSAIEYTHSAHRTKEILPGGKTKEKRVVVFRPRFWVKFRIKFSPNQNSSKIQHEIRKQLCVLLVHFLGSVYPSYLTVWLYCVGVVVLFFAVGICCLLWVTGVFETSKETNKKNKNDYGKRSHILSHHISLLNLPCTLI